MRWPVQSAAVHLQRGMTGLALLEGRDAWDGP
jgi:hypothetical protein